MRSPFKAKMQSEDKLVPAKRSADCTVDEPPANEQLSVQEGSDESQDNFDSFVSSQGTLQSKKLKLEATGQASPSAARSNQGRPVAPKERGEKSGLDGGSQQKHQDAEEAVSQQESAQPPSSSQSSVATEGQGEDEQEEQGSQRNTRMRTSMQKA